MRPISDWKILKADPQRPETELKGFEPVCHTTVERRFNEPLFNENFDLTNGILCPSNSKIYEREPRFNEPSI